MLAAGKVHPKLAQRLARHSDINLTMSRYSHTLRTDESKALTALPQFPSMFDSPQTESATLRATGTDNARSDVLQEKGTNPRPFVPLSASSGDLVDGCSTPTKKPRNSRENRNSGAIRPAEREGFEPSVPLQ